MPKLHLHGPMTWKVMQRNVWKDFANWRTKRLCIFSRSRRHTWMIDHQFKDEETRSAGELSTVLKWPYLARIGNSDIFMVCEQTCLCSHKMDKSM